MYSFDLSVNKCTNSLLTTDGLAFNYNTGAFDY